MGTRGWLAACAAAMACAWAGSAGATVYTITFSDQGGDALQFTFNSSLGEPTGDGGLMGSGAASPITDVTATYGGASVTFVPTYSTAYLSISQLPGGQFTGFVDMQAQGADPARYDAEAGAFGFTNVSFGPSGFSADSPNSVADLYTYVFTPPDTWSSQTLLHIGPDHITISPAPGAPEPSTWALAVLGIGLAGAAMRRRAALVYG